MLAKMAMDSVPYFRFVNVNDEIHCSLLMSKSRVTPLKAVTVPKLEVTAVVSAKINVMLKKKKIIKI